MIETLSWILPRPRHHRMYKGGFPLHFEKKLLVLYDYPELILHPFGGFAEYGITTDILMAASPDIQADAHYLPFGNDTFDFIIFDPPYSAEEAMKLYGTPYIRLIKCVNESVRVLKVGGYIALYHRLWLPRPKGTSYDKRILIHPGQWHECRTCHIFKKDKYV
jgi:SAM-dependent methyltransferase